ADIGFQSIEPPRAIDPDPVENLNDKVSIFISYAHEDEPLWNKLNAHLAALKREGTIDVWYDRHISPGDNFPRAISGALEAAQVIVLLVSSDFINSDYCYQVEMRRAMERHRAGQAKVLPVILRPCSWSEAPFRSLSVTPRDGIPVTKWPDIDEALVNITHD